VASCCAGPASAWRLRPTRCAVSAPRYSAERASRSNDAHVITLGARVIGTELARAIVDSFITSSFDGGRSVPKVEAISTYENARH